MNIFKEIPVALLVVVCTGCGGQTDNSGDGATNASTSNNDNKIQHAGFTKTSNTFTLNDANITWQDNSEIYIPKAQTRYEAMTVCENLSLDSINNWRLPTKNELADLYINNRDSLSYTYDNYLNESYANENTDYTFRYIGWTSTHHVWSDGKDTDSAVNETVSYQTQKEIIYFPIEGYVRDKSFSIRCVSDINTSN